jgi:hypothetical protein
MPRKSQSAGDFVSVACKLPQGLNIMHPDTGALLVKIHGCASPYAVAGHGMTQVRADTWALVEKHYGADGMNAKWLSSEAVFAMNKPEDASDKAEDLKDERRGFEQIDPRDPNSGLPASMRIQAEGGEDKGR